MDQSGTINIWQRIVDLCHHWLYTNFCPYMHQDLGFAGPPPATFNVRLATARSQPQPPPRHPHAQGWGGGPWPSLGGAVSEPGPYMRRGAVPLLREGAVLAWLHLAGLVPSWKCCHHVCVHRLGWSLGLPWVFPDGDWQPWVPHAEVNNSPLWSNKNIQSDS